MSTVVLAVTGMSCGGCSAAVTRALTGLPGVIRVEVVLTSGRATLTIDPARVTLDQVCAAVVKAGFTATPV